MNDDLRFSIDDATLALGRLEAAARDLDTAAVAAIDADTALRQAKATLDDWEAVLLLEAQRVGALDGSNETIRKAQARGYRAASADWTEATAAHEHATVSAARARQAAESAGARYTVAQEAVRLHVALVSLLARGL